MFPYSKFETDFNGLPLSVEIGKVAPFTNGACIVNCADTVVLSTVTMSDRPNEEIDFLSLTVNFEERNYSSGRIPGSFSRREGKPSDASILVSRLIDRSIRPLFSPDVRNDISVTCILLSLGERCIPEVAALIATSISLSISDVPWKGPTSSCVVGLLDSKIVINPSISDMQKSDLHMSVSSANNKITMIEAGANQVPENVILNCLHEAHSVNTEMIKFISDIQSQVGKKKRTLDNKLEYSEVESQIFHVFGNEISSALETIDKTSRDNKINSIRDKIFEKFSDLASISYLEKTFSKIQKSIVRKWIFESGKRVDGRSLDQIRDLHCEVGVLPRTHGSAIFSRGFTQVMTIATLASLHDCKLVDEFYDEHDKYYLHHYNFPPFSVGEARSPRAPSRREIGHGALAERALYPVIPSTSTFPYTIRLVSEVLSSNGSTSQASVCGSTLALMDAGVPIKAPVAGISCGLVTKDSSWTTFTDIQGIEDFFGDMDFKVAGTKNGITAIQLDIKIEGLTFDIIEDALDKTKTARFKILDFMSDTINAPRSEISQHAPKILFVAVPEDKIRDVIGSGGSMVRKLCSDYNVKIDIEDDGRIYVSSTNMDNCVLAVEQINSIVRDVSIGDIITGKVTRIASFGVFVSIGPGKEGMCHISSLSNRRVERITDIINVGDIITVKVSEIDNKGRINLQRISANQSFK